MTEIPKKRNTRTITHTTEIKVKFSDVDALAIVWHGHYIRYFEDGREAFGEKYGLAYLDVFENGLVTPIVNANINYKAPLEYGDTAVIETTFVDHPAAKINFNFTIRNKKNNNIVATGSTTQVFLDAQNRELFWTNPPFFMKWKKKWLGA